MNNIPTIAFMNLGPSDMEHACEVYAGIPLDTLEESINDYLSISDIKYHSNFEYVCMGQILYDDCKFLEDNTRDIFINLYKHLRNKYGQKFMDIIVTKNNDKIVKNITNVINFMFDKVFKTDTIQVIFSNVSGNKNEKSNYPNLIYSALQQNFIIKSQRENEMNHFIIIQKGSIQNVNNAN